MKPGDTEKAAQKLQEAMDAYVRGNIDRKKLRKAVQAYCHAVGLHREES